MRIHIPVVTNAGVDFRLNGARCTMAAGSSWYLRLSDPHSVANRGGTERVHLVIDAQVNRWVEALFERAFLLPASGRRGNGNLQCGLLRAFLLEPPDSKARATAGLLAKPDRPQQRSCVQVLVRDNNVDQALKALKKKMQREGIFREMKLRGHYEKPSEKKAREKAEAIRRARKLARKKMQREGLLPMKPRVVPGAGGPGGRRWRRRFGGGGGGGRRFG